MTNQGRQRRKKRRTILNNFEGKTNASNKLKLKLESAEPHTAM